ncbi:winged helix-turn-helix domain-containing protein [Pseudolysobacter antarcticus]|uniref:winged helix-turn-helix domain-containing protein n=1 Tax=Pseudolysobacter antarcticus TaxID=2511995 RepID=UPI0013ED72FE|nr:winged helix-turn-helix domain-containing protein [Pseudolysobacter antarcticus]
MPSTSLYRIGEYSIDLATRAIRRGDAPVDVEAKVFDLIALLLIHHDRALSKREINDTLWGQRPVTDAALSQLLSKARRALGDDGESQHVIRTVHGRGLQWAAPVLIAGDEKVEVTIDPQPMSSPAAIKSPARSVRGWWLAALAALLLIVAALLIPHFPPSAADGRTLSRIAVLPITDKTAEPGLAWTRNGLMGLIASLLQEQGKVEVIGAQLVQSVVGTHDSFDAAALAALGKSLGATHFVSGELRRVGSLYELELRLSIDGSIAHRETLRATSPTPLAVDSVARIQRWLGVVPLASASRDDSDIRNPFLAEAYARGLDAAAHGDEASAKKYFQICLDQDPGLLWPRLRLATSQGSTNEIDSSVENAKRVADIARQRGDHDLLVLALRQLSASNYFKGDGDAAAGYLDEALSLLPDNSRPLTLAGVHSTYGAVEIKRGHLAQARQHLELALPLTRAAGSRRNESSVLANLAIVDGEQGHFKERLIHFREAIDAAREAGSKDLEMRELGGLGAAEFDAGHALTAVPMLQQTLALARELSDLHTQVHVGTNLARVLATFGHYEAAEALAQRAQEIALQKDNKNWQAKALWARGVIAEQRAAWGDASAALDSAHELFAAVKANLDDAAVLADATRVATRGGNVAAAEHAAAALALLIQADPANPEMATMQPLVQIQLQYAHGQRTEAIAALQRLVDANATRADGPPKLDALLLLGHWRVDTNDATAALALMPALAPWLEQQPEAIALHIAALRGAGQTDAADAEQKRLDQLKQSADLVVDSALLAPLIPTASPAPQASK